ncbi:hypothetical protein D3C78_1312130 [compost metagenome]
MAVKQRRGDHGRGASGKKRRDKLPLPEQDGGTGASRRQPRAARLAEEQRGGVREQRQQAQQRGGRASRFSPLYSYAPIPYIYDYLFTPTLLLYAL